MILYNVTVNIDDDVHEAWLGWMKYTHLPMVMATGKFLHSKMFRILSRQEDESGTTYSIQYTARKLEDYESYQKEHASSLQAETEKHFAGKFVAFRTILELEHEYEQA